MYCSSVNCTNNTNERLYDHEEIKTEKAQEEDWGDGTL